MVDSPSATPTCSRPTPSSDSWSISMRPQPRSGRWVVLRPHQTVWRRRPVLPGVHGRWQGAPRPTSDRFTYPQYYSSPTWGDVDGDGKSDLVRWGAGSGSSGGSGAGASAVGAAVEMSVEAEVGRVAAADSGPAPPECAPPPTTGSAPPPAPIRDQCRKAAAERDPGGKSFEPSDDFSWAAGIASQRTSVIRSPRPLRRGWKSRNSRFQVPHPTNLSGFAANGCASPSPRPLPAVGMGMGAGVDLEAKRWASTHRPERVDMGPIAPQELLAS